MKARILYLAIGWLSAVSTAIAFADDGAMRAAAVGYFEALLQGRAQTADALSAVPFVVVGEPVIRDAAELRAMHAQIVADKVAGALPAFDVVVRPLDAEPLDAQVFPGPYEVVRLQFHDPGMGGVIDFYVDDRAGQARVIGIAQ